MSTIEFTYGEYEELFVRYEDGTIDAVYLTSEHVKDGYIELDLSSLTKKLEDELDARYEELYSETDEAIAEAKQELDDLNAEFWSSR